MNQSERLRQRPGYEEVVAENVKLRERVTELEARLKTLEARLAQDSHNSNKPPSGNFYGRRTKSQHSKSEQLPRGQKGHKAKTLKMLSNPDELLLHQMEACSGCGAAALESVLIGFDKR